MLRIDHKALGQAALAHNSTAPTARKNIISDRKPQFQYKDWSRIMLGINSRSPFFGDCLHDTTLSLRGL
jgi:hypothetical protein